MVSTLVDTIIQWVNLFKINFAIEDLTDCRCKESRYPNVTFSSTADGVGSSSSLERKYKGEMVVKSAFKISEVSLEDFTVDL